MDTRKLLAGIVGGAVLGFVAAMTVASNSAPPPPSTPAPAPTPTANSNPASTPANDEPLAFTDPLTDPLPASVAGLAQLVDRLRADLGTARTQLQTAKVTAVEQADMLADTRAKFDAVATELASATAELARIKAEYGIASGPDEAALTPEQIQARIAEANAALDAAFTEKNGEQAIAAIRALIDLGESGYADAMAAILRVHHDVLGAKTLGLTDTMFYRTTSDTGLYEFALDRKNGAPAAFREYATWGYPWMVDGKTITKTYARELPDEENDRVAQAMIYQLGQTPTPEAADALIAAYQAAARTGNLSRQQDILKVLGQNPNQNAQDFIRHIALYETNDELRTFAESLQSAVPGLFITGVTEGSQAQVAGLQPGDILMKYGGQLVTSLPQLGELKARFQAGDEIPIEVWRQGNSFQTTIKAGTIGVNGYYVAGR